DQRLLVTFQHDLVRFVPGREVVPPDLILLLFVAGNQIAPAGAQDGSNRLVVVLPDRFGQHLSRRFRCLKGLLSRSWLRRRRRLASGAKRQAGCEKKRENAASSKHGSHRRPPPPPPPPPPGRPPPPPPPGRPPPPPPPPGRP